MPNRARFVTGPRLAVLAGVLLSAASGSIMQAASAIYVGTSALSANSVGLFKSTDNGATLVSLADNVGFPPHPLLQGSPTVTEIAVDPQDSNVLYVVVSFDVTKTGLLKTVNGGATWTAIPLLGVSSAARSSSIR